MSIPQFLDLIPQDILANAALIWSIFYKIPVSWEPFNFLQVQFWIAGVLF